MILRELWRVYFQPISRRVGRQLKAYAAVNGVVVAIAAITTRLATACGSRFSGVTTTPSSVVGDWLECAAATLLTYSLVWTACEFNLRGRTRRQHGHKYESGGGDGSRRGEVAEKGSDEPELRLLDCIWHVLGAMVERMAWVRLLRSESHGDGGGGGGDEGGEGSEGGEGGGGSYDLTHYGVEVAWLISRLFLFEVTYDFVHYWMHRASHSPGTWVCVGARPSDD